MIFGFLYISIGRSDVATTAWAALHRSLMFEWISSLTNRSKERLLLVWHRTLFRWHFGFPTRDPTAAGRVASHIQKQARAVREAWRSYRIGEKNNQLCSSALSRLRKQGLRELRKFNTMYRLGVKFYPAETKDRSIVYCYHPMSGRTGNDLSGSFLRARIVRWKEPSISEFAKRGR